MRLGNDDIGLLGNSLPLPPPKEGEREVGAKKKEVIWRLYRKKGKD